MRLPEFLVATGDTANNTLVEALGPEWHYGETGFFDRPGHIPRGILLPSADLYNADKTFKSPAEIARMLAHLGIRPEQRIHTYCGGGVAASVPFFALKFLMGYPDVKLFVESELGWLKDDRGLPFWTYGDPNLMRETGWLKAWGGRMMRMYGISQVSVVDVRPAEEFKFGHVPFALNVPASEFRRHFSEPGKLAQVLGAAGVNDAHEAVVISGAGLTKDSALAYLMLERLGQRRVSVFMDSLEKSVQAGFALPADAKKAPAQAPRPTSYEARLRKGVVIADPAETRGQYPKIFVASGKQVPARLPDGKVVHVPFTELAERRRHAEGREGHLEDSCEGRGLALRRTRELLRRSGRGGGQLLHPQADGISRREGDGFVAQCPLVWRVKDSSRPRRRGSSQHRPLDSRLRGNDGCARVLDSPH